ncbi:uncharacterized protein LOC128547012 [Mercenaria mercenaria]|uniref:uncharacterized protein LOC128547012 n=1 Tax=Mercenaria mercenaria TaxID=6596 RepID=UPI00234F503D|nr:uncharacterized protein LOC128547012 [Mercenaria mercenaria]
MKRSCFFSLCGIICMIFGNVQPFDFRDEIAQGTCTALLTGTDYALAVQRTCTSTTKESCSKVCNEIGKVCYNSLHIYSVSPLKSFKYDSCSNTGCGPNFCCCSGKTPPSSHEYKAKIAQATCTGILYGTANYVSAVTRQCTSTAETCETVCTDLGKTCFNSLHLYDRKPKEVFETGSVSLKTYKYNSCTVVGCGPNFCCCSGN